MTTSDAVGRQASSRRIAASLVSRSAYLLYSAMAIFLGAGFLGVSSAPVWTKLRVGFPLAQLCLTAYHVRQVRAVRPFNCWNDARIKLGLIVFATACTAPFAILLYFIFFPPRFGAEMGGSLFLGIMGLLFLFYGGLLLVSPRLAVELDYGKGKLDVASDSGKRMMGAFLFVVGSLLAYVALRLFILH